MEPQLTLADAEALSYDILSDNKKARKEARFKLISFRDLPPIMPYEVNQCPNYYLISLAINVFVNSSSFIFNVKPDHAGDVLEKGKITKLGTHKNLPIESNKPTYFVTMPHLAGKNNLDEQIKILFEESFGSNAEESKLEASQRLQLFVGINYCHSINHIKNKERKKYISDLFEKEIHPNVSYEAFRWSSQWICNEKAINGLETIIFQIRIKKAILESNFRALLSDLRGIDPNLIAQICLRIENATSEKIIQEVIGQLNTDLLKSLKVARGNEKNVRRKPIEINIYVKIAEIFKGIKLEKNVPQFIVKRVFRVLHEVDAINALKIYENLNETTKPYQHFREEIIRSPSFNMHLKTFRSIKLDRPCFLGTVDDDAVALRTSERGLYSHYDLLIESNPFLEAASTGYYMKDANHKFIEIASYANLVARQAIGHLRGNAPYLPEPNALFKIPYGDQLNNTFSFVAKSRSGRNAGNLESLRMLENLGLMEGNVQGRVVFGLNGAIQTGVSPNVNVPRRLLNIVDPKLFLISKNLHSLRAFSQSQLHLTHGFAMNIMRTFPEGFNTGDLRGVITHIYRAFDPIEYSDSIPNFWLEAFPDVFREVFKIYNLGENEVLGNPDVYDDNYFKNISSSLNFVKDLKLSEDDTVKIALLIKEKSINLHQAIRSLQMTGMFKYEDILLIVKTCHNINMNVFHYLKSVINNEPFNMTLIA